MLDVLVFLSHAGTPTLSYYWDWAETLCAHPRFRVDVVDTRAKGRLALALLRRRRRRYDLIFFPYGFYYANQDRWSRALFDALADLRGKRVFFMENEYRLVNRKLAMAVALEADYITTQLPIDVAVQAYEAMFPPSRIVALPHGLNTRILDWCPAGATGSRPIDLGCTGDPYPFYLGHQDRAVMADYFKENAGRYGLRIDVRVGREQRMERREWIEWLGRSKGALHHESGPDFLETNDATRLAVVSHVQAHPGAAFAEIHQRFFAGRKPRLSGRALAPRHLEAVATRTCQVMFPGRFNDVLRADEHYIPLERDFSNVDDVVRRLLDDGEREAIVARALEYVRAGHTLEHRLEALLSAVGAG